MLSPRLDITVEQLADVEKCLDSLQRETRARWVLLADVTGQFISECGLLCNMNSLNVEALSALAAGNLATTREMARLTGEEARFKLLLYEGERQSVYLSDVGGEFVLVTAFDESVSISTVRLYTKQIVDRLQEILHQARATVSPPAVGLDEDFGELLATEMDFSF
jgi:predicted regulator of Ras-like GTPase activity (Roadblock/LC7/MglB family)